MKKIAVILFPGSNCENESQRVMKAVGLDADIVRWNDSDGLKEYDGYFLVGGWSYEDRIRAGVVSAKDPVMQLIKSEAKTGKVVLGICNGAQILVETGMIPNVNSDNIEMALAPNINPKIQGFYCRWVKLKCDVKRGTAFNIDLPPVLPMPIAHGEGRFVTTNEALMKKLEDNEQIMFRYCDDNGEAVNKFPVNPNGSMESIAGLVNKTGNVLAMMPHPERASWYRQLPYFEGTSFEAMEKLAPAAKIFESIKRYLER